VSEVTVSAHEDRASSQHAKDDGYSGGADARVGPVELVRCDRRSPRGTAHLLKALERERTARGTRAQRLRLHARGAGDSDDPILGPADRAGLAGTRRREGDRRRPDSSDDSSAWILDPHRNLLFSFRREEGRSGR